MNNQVDTWQDCSYCQHTSQPGHFQHLYNTTCFNQLFNILYISFLVALWRWRPLDKKTFHHYDCDQKNKPCHQNMLWWSNTYFFNFYKESWLVWRQLLNQHLCCTIIQSKIFFNAHTLPFHLHHNSLVAGFLTESELFQGISKIFVNVTNNNILRHIQFSQFSVSYLLNTPTWTLYNVDKTSMSVLSMYIIHIFITTYCSFDQELIFLNHWSKLPCFIAY